MWIKSQDRKILINADYVWIEEKKDLYGKPIYFKICTKKEGTNIALGYYNTETQARIVLDSIQCKIYDNFGFYQLPIKEEV